MPRRIYSSLLLLVLLFGSGCIASSTDINCATLPIAAKASATASTPPACPLPPMEYPFRNLVLQGGGVLGSAYAGSLAVLDQQGIYPRIERVAGTSAGAIIAMLVALRFEPKDIDLIVNNLNFRQFQDGGSISRLVRNFGYYKGDFALGLFRCLITRKLGLPPDKKVTFRDLHAGNFRDLAVFSTDISTRSSKEFSFATTPDFEVAAAVRMSMSIPFFFAAIDQNQKIFVDGGVLRNYPIDLFDSANQVNPTTLGLSLQDVNARKTPESVSGLSQYIKAVFATLIGVQDVALGNNLPDLERTVVIDDLGISFTDFGISPETKEALVAAGAICTCNYLVDWQKWNALGELPSATIKANESEVVLNGVGRCGMVLPAAAARALAAGRQP